LLKTLGLSETYIANYVRNLNNDENDGYDEPDPLPHPLFSPAITAISTAPVSSLLGRRFKRDQPDSRVGFTRDRVIPLNLQEVFSNLSRNIDSLGEAAVNQLVDHGFKRSHADLVVNELVQDYSDQLRPFGFMEPQESDINSVEELFIIQMDTGDLLVADSNSRPRILKHATSATFNITTFTKVSDLIKHAYSQVTDTLGGLITKHGGRPKRCSIFFVAPVDIVYDKVTEEESKVPLDVWTQATDSIAAYENARRRTPYVKAGGEGVTFSFYGTSLMDSFWVCSAAMPSRDVKAVVEVHVQIEYPRRGSNKTYRKAGAKPVYQVSKSKPKYKRRSKKTYKKKYYKKRK